MKKYKISIILLMVLNLIILSLFLFLFLGENNHVKDSIKKTVEIKVYDDESIVGYATGCVISKNGDILTNKHVVQRDSGYYSNILVRFYDSEDYINAEVLKVSNESDLAIIKINKQTEDFFKISNNELQTGDEVFTIGNPNGFGLSYTKGNVSSAKKHVVYNESSIYAIQTDLIINEGNSGGPLINNQGELAGVMSFRLKDKEGNVLQGLSFAVPLDDIRDIIK